MSKPARENVATGIRCPLIATLRASTNQRAKRIKQMMMVQLGGRQRLRAHPGFRHLPLVNR